MYRLHGENRRRVSKRHIFAAAAVYPGPAGATAFHWRGLPPVRVKPCQGGGYPAISGSERCSGAKVLPPGETDLVRPAAAVHPLLHCSSYWTQKRPRRGVFLRPPLENAACDIRLLAVHVYTDTQ